MPLGELYSVKHPTAWVDFEKGDISKDVLVSRFFKDGRSFDSEGIGHMMVGRMPPLTLKASHITVGQPPGQAMELTNTRPAKSCGR